jgi:hypothetical protein
MLAQNYQDPELFWALQLLEFASLRKLNTIEPIQIARTFSGSPPAVDLLPAIANTTYFLRNLEMATSAAITGAPLLQFFEPFSTPLTTLAFVRAWNTGVGNTWSGSVRNIITPQLRYAAGMSAGTINVNGSGYRITWT